MNEKSMDKLKVMPNQETKLNISEPLQEPSEIKYQEIIGENLPEAVFVLSGGVNKSYRGSSEDVFYRSPSYGSRESVHGFATGGRARTIAAAFLGKEYPELKFVATSWADKSGPSDASVLTEELIQRGIAPERISLEEKSFNTFSELVEMAKMAVEQGWKNIVAITNDYHIARCKAMMERLELAISVEPDFAKTLAEFKQRNIKVAFVAAEDVLNLTTGHDGHYQKYLDSVRETDGYKKICESEKNGLNALLSGNYKFRPRPE